MLVENMISRALHISVLVCTLVQINQYQTRTSNEAGVNKIPPSRRNPLGILGISLKRMEKIYRYIRTQEYAIRTTAVQTSYHTYEYAVSHHLYRTGVCLKKV